MTSQDQEGDVFAIPDLWQSSKWLTRLDHDQPGSFFAHNVKEILRKRQIDFLEQASLNVDTEGFFKFPLTGTNQPGYAPPAQSPSASESESPLGSVSLEYDNNVWLGTDEAPVPQPEWRTWDAFLAGSNAQRQTLFLSEAGPSAYDAVLSSQADPLDLKNSDVSVVQSSVYLASLRSMALGCESMFFARLDPLPYFKATVPKMRISGFSREVLKALEEECLQSGTLQLELRSFVRSIYSKHMTPSGVALASTIDHILRAIQAHVSVEEKMPQTPLQLQATVRSIMCILRPLFELVGQLKRNLTNENIISVVFDRASLADNLEGHSRDMIREILQRVSRPWIEFVEEWLGTQPEHGLGLTKSDVGASKSFVKVAPEIYMDDSGNEVHEVDFRLDIDKLPAFMPLDVAELVFETGRNLRFIGSNHPEHPLAQPDLIASCKPPNTEWRYDWDAITQLEKRVAEYQKRLVDALQASHSACPCSHELVNMATVTNTTTEHEFFGFGNDGQIEQQFAGSMEQLNQPPGRVGPNDALSNTVRRRLRGEPPIDDSESDRTPHWSLLPILSFGSIASAQAQVVNQETLRLLFAAHGLREHLHLQRDFHLFGNGNFCTRLSHALFDPDMESAERQTGVALQGGLMGLRLGGRDSWPPASSELRLALMGVLAETYNPRISLKASTFDQNPSKDSSGLPGDLSFSVRDLSEEEIEKCMDPDSLEALDFLRLSYKTPGSLASIFTPAILMQYDRIFRFLLRILRMVYVSDQLFRDVNGRHSRWSDPTSSAYRLARESRHFVGSVASYIFGSGVATTWQVFDQKLDKIEVGLECRNAKASSRQTHSPDTLRQLHTSVLDRIMQSLFLRKRQQPVQKLLQDILNVVLKFAKLARLAALGHSSANYVEQESARLYREFKKKVQLFITVCRSLTEKTKSTSGSRKVDGEEWLGQDDGLGDEHMVAQLLMKLDMFDYYVKR